MSLANVEIVRKAIQAWNQREADLLLSYAAPEIEWMPAGPAAVESAVYRGHDEVASAYAAVWETWDLFQFEEGQVRDLGDSVLWLGRVKMRGSASQVALDQEFAAHWVVRDAKLSRIQAFLSWKDALKAVGLVG
jgi:ketosteroid isomerase-like protein